MKLTDSIKEEIKEFLLIYGFFDHTSEPDAIAYEQFNKKHPILNISYKSFKKQYDYVKSTIMKTKAQLDEEYQNKDKNKKIKAPREKFIDVRPYLLKYRVTTFCQGTEDVGIDYALVYGPNDSTFNNKRSTLMNKKHIPGVYEIDIESVTDETVKW